MPEQPGIFISHSSLDNDVTRKLCTALQSPDGYKPIVDFDVLVDYARLVSGKYWPSQLHVWMAKCRAAVLLLTPNAVRSPWVLKEATILAWRLSLDGNFRLFTVRYPDVTDQMLSDEKFEPLNLGGIQQISDPDPANVALKIRETFGVLAAAPTLFDKLVGGLRDVLSKVGPNTLRSIAEKIQVTAPAWRPDLDERQQYVDAIATDLLSESLGGYRGIDELVDDLSATTAAETVRQIFELVAPYWVDAEAAGKLPALTSRKPRRAAAMNGAKVTQYTAAMYVRRAHPLSNRFRVIPTAGGAAGDLVRHYTNEICSYIRRRDNTEDTNEAIIAQLANRRPAFYVVLGEIPDQATLNMLHERFPALTFILWTGEALQPDDNLPEVEWLHPVVDLSREAKEAEDCFEAESIIRNITSR